MGIPAFLAVWDRLPYWNVLPPVLRAVPFMIPAAEAAYRFWARHRLSITGRNSLATGSSCDATSCEIKAKP